MNSTFTESIVEDAALACLQALEYTVLHGPDIAAGEPASGRSDPNYPAVGSSGGQSVRSEFTWRDRGGCHGDGCSR